MAQHRAGTVSVTNGSTTVTGVNTFFISGINLNPGVSVGDLFFIPGDRAYYNIASIVSETEITIIPAYGGTSRSDLGYVIASDFTPNFDLATFQPGDRGTADIFTRNMRLIDSELLSAASSTRAIKDSVRVATTSSLNLSTELEDSDTVDGVQLSEGDRVLVKNQVDASQNGIYIVQLSGPPVRAVDFDEPGDVVQGTRVGVIQGDDNAGSTYYLTSPEPPGGYIIGTSLLEFSVVTVAVGPTPNFSVGTVSSVPAGGTPTVTLTGTGTDPVINFGLVVGNTGQAATISVGSVSTGLPGSNASVSNSGTPQAAVFDFTLPRGDTGATPNISIGTTTKVSPGGNPDVQITGTAEDPVLSFSLVTGDTGATPNFSIGTVTTIPSTDPAVVTVTGTPENPVLNLSIPQGRPGIDGAGGGVYQIVGERAASFDAPEIDPISFSFGNGSSAPDRGIVVTEAVVLDGVSFRATASNLQDVTLIIRVNNETIATAPRVLTVAAGQTNGFANNLNIQLQPGDYFNIMAFGQTNGVSIAAATLLTSGAKGEAATINVGTTTTLPAGSNASVVNSGNAGDAVFDFSIPQGRAATVGIGTVTTLPPGSTATVTNVGTPEDAVFNFALPRGQDGTGTGTVTSVAISGSDGIEVDSGSPITSNGTIALGIDAPALRTHADLWTNTEVQNYVLSLGPLYVIITGSGTALAGVRYLANSASDHTVLLDLNWVVGQVFYMAVQGAIKTIDAGSGREFIGVNGDTDQTITMRAGQNAKFIVESSTQVRVMQGD